MKPEREAHGLPPMEFFEEVLESLEDTVHVVDRDLVVRYCTRNIETLSRGRVTAGRLLGYPLGEETPFLKETGVVEEYRRVFREGLPVVTHASCEGDDGPLIFRVAKIPLRDREGRVDRVMTVVRDITRDCRVEEERGFLTRAIEDASVGIAIVGKDKCWESLNQKFAQMHGCHSPDEIRGRDWKELFPRDFREEHRARIEAALEETGRWSGETRLERRDGSTLPVLMSINVLRTQPGSRHRYLLVAQDISREKGMGEEMSRKNRELEDLNRELNSFISMTSHELRSPLANIEGFARLLDERFEELSPGETREFITRILGNALRLHLLIDDLLLFSRERKRALEYTEVDLPSLMKDVLGYLGKKVEASGAEVSLDLEPKTARGDRQKLFHILRSLLENALTYVRAGERPRVAVSVVRGDEGSLVFSVADNGPGIHQEEKEMIFEIFRRGFASRGTPGTGVGLAFVKDNVQRMGGQVWVRSDSAGATFSFSLPGHPV